MMDELAMTHVDNWAWRFTTMLTLAVVVAVMGLSADSAAVVIGAMLLAPLMQPVLATAASLSMSLVRKALWSLIKVLLATAWCIAIAYALALILPDGPLPGEVEARTRPDIRDLVVALAAGAAGSYATVRKDVSSSLPGVAVAVALVPPLAAIGITLERGETDLAIGASLLYGTNLAAIIFAGVMVFIATGFVPPRRLSNTALQLGVAGVIALAVVVVVAVPLFNRSLEAVEAVREEVTAREVVDNWLNGLELAPEVDVDNGRVLVKLRGFEAPPDDGILTEALELRLGEDISVTVEWVRTERATTIPPAVLTDEEALVLQIGLIVDQWLIDNDGGSDYEQGRLAVNDGVVKIDVAGPGEPPSVEDLVDRIHAEVDADLLRQPDGTTLDLAVRLNWTERQIITPGVETTVPPVQIIEEEMAVTAAEWSDQVEVEIESVVYDGERVVVSVIGPNEPAIFTLKRELREIADAPDLDVQVFFTQRRLVTTTTFVVPELSGLAPGAPTTTTTPATTTTTTG